MAERAVVDFLGEAERAPFLGRRFLHARRYGAWRGAEMSALEVLARSAATLFVAIILGYRILRTLRTPARLRARWLAAVPILAVFLLGWAIGEAIGLWQSRYGRSVSQDSVAPRPRLRTVDAEGQGGTT
jgi:hypothetical protein